MIRKLRQGIGGLFYGWRPKVIRNHPGHHELLLPLGTCVGSRYYRYDLRSLSQLCSNDVGLYRSRPDRKLPLHFAHEAVPAFPLAPGSLNRVRIVTG